MAIRPIHCSLERVNTMESGRYRNGTTLIEILVVVAVIMILAGIVTAVGIGIDSHSKKRAVKGTFALLEGALQEYYDFRGSFPLADDPARAPVENCEILYAAVSSLPDSRKVLERISDKIVQNKGGPTAVPEVYDPWGTVLNYRYNSGDSFPMLTSAGPNRIFNDGDDVTNR